MSQPERRAIWGWSLYDWANSAFATTVMAGFFPVFFKQFWSTGLDPTLSTARLAVANSLAGLVIALLAPFLGAMADHGSAKKKFLLGFALLGMAGTMSLSLVGQGLWPAAVMLFVLASVGFSGGNIFYDALLPQVASKRQVDRVSALGFALGYLGGGLLFALNVLMTRQPAWFGLPDAAAAVKVSFLTVGIWWGLFTVPLLLWVREPSASRPASPFRLIRAGYSQVLSTLRELRHFRTIFLFLLAYWLYIDGVYTVIRMAVDYGLSLGLASGDLILALLLTQFVGFPAALAFGFLGTRIGTRRAIFLALGVYLGVTLWASLMRTSLEFFGLAVTIGLVQGGIQAMSRAYYVKLIPRERAAEFFGFYNMVGKFAAIIGPLFIGGVGLTFRALGYSSSLSARFGVASIVLLFILGGLLLSRVRETGG